VEGRRRGGGEPQLPVGTEKWYIVTRIHSDVSYIVINYLNNTFLPKKL
jgi:hypothetical protein